MVAGASLLLRALPHDLGQAWELLGSRAEVGHRPRTPASGMRGVSLGRAGYAAEVVKHFAELAIERIRAAASREL